MKGVRSPRLHGRAKRAVMLAMLLSAVAAVVATAPSSGYETGFENPGGCGCHGSENPSVTVGLAGLPEPYDPGQTYELDVSVQGGPATSFGGFYMSADGGAFSDPGLHAKIVGNVVTHADPDVRSWTVSWTAPAADFGTVTFDLIGNAVNGDGGFGGDAWSAATFTSTEWRDVPAISTNLDVTAPAAIRAGEEFTLTATLSETNGTPIEGASVSFYLKSSFGTLLMGNSTTDANGTALLDYDHVAGEFLVDVKFRGGGDYEGSSATVTLQIEGGAPGDEPLLSPAALTVSVVTLVLAGVWACYYYVLYLAFGISREGKEE